jgi:hypothetical protein
MLKLLVLTGLCALAAIAQPARIAGRILDPQGQPVSGAALHLSSPSGKTVAAAGSDSDGRFTFPALPAGSYVLTANASGFAAIEQKLNTAAGDLVTLRFTTLATRSESVSISSAAAQLDMDHPDPSQKLFIRDDILDANPGRPGAPVSIPGLPIETASGGIKAPQYFAPGVAGDHGEPIATFWQIGGYLAPNNLSSNAHGNGYSDPNIIVPALIEAVASDGGAFNVREGNHSVNAAETYSLHSRLEPFLTLTGDQRDLDLTAGWNWIAIEAAYGNGFLDRLEHRQQYKINTLHTWNIGRHDLALFGIGYFGRSMIPGLVPVGVSGLNDTIDPRQKDETHTTEFVLNDAWTISSDAQLQSSAFFRTYSLALYSNFGDGLIRQSEFRTEQGGNETYTRRISHSLSLMAGFDYFRDAPRRLDLDHYLADDPSYYGPFEKVTANNVTLNFLTPFIALEGHPFRWLRYNLGWRRDQIGIANQDLLHPANSSQAWVGVNSPKATLSLIAPERSILPTVSLSFGQAFFTNDPRIGNGAMEGTRVSRAHSWQLVVSKYVGATELRATLGHLTQEASLAKIDPDTGLQEDEGASRNLYITLAVRRRFSAGGFEASFSKADARDLSGGAPVPEAPRLIADAIGTIDRLPWRLRARGEFEYVGARPLGDAFTGIPIREFRGALVRPFLNERLIAGVNFLLASGYTGQTTEVFALSGEAAPFERVVGVYLPSYATVSFTYRFPPRRVP